MNGGDRILGIVERGKFRPLEATAPSGSALRLTRISPHSGQTPETGESDVTEYEGSVIMVAGNNQGHWIYSAEVIDQATPIVTELIRRVFDASAGYAKGTNIVRLDADVAEVFSDSEVVNRALRALAGIIKERSQVYVEV